MKKVQEVMLSEPHQLTEPTKQKVQSDFQPQRILTRRLYNQAMGRAIVTLRSACSLTSLELTAACGVQYFRLQQIERGLLSASVEELHSLAQFFDLSLSELVLLAENLAVFWRV